MKEPAVLSVTELNNFIKKIFDDDPVLTFVYVRAEISNYTLHSSGHHYFKLKDEHSVISAVMFKFDASRLKFKLENGMNVIARGRVGLFPKSGQYQLYISEIIPDGVGALFVAFEQLKSRLMKEGLFDPAYKKPLPEYPAKIALVTSPTGAAVRDMIRIIHRRYPLAEILVCPVRVQGADAPGDLADALRHINKHRLCDVIVTGRGGGSIEDLWAFNDESVARAIFASDIPVISAVGHEPDVTIADFVADVRASTPSNAAEIVVPDIAELRGALCSFRTHLISRVSRDISLLSTRLSALSKRPVMQTPNNYIQDRRMSLGFLEQRFLSSASMTVTKKKQDFLKLTSLLDAFGPLKVLSRGYSIAEKDKKVVASTDNLNVGDNISLRFSKGSAECEVIKTYR